MAGILLADQEGTVTNDLDNVEQTKLNHYQMARKYYEELIENITLSKNALSFPIFIMSAGYFPAFYS
jgi:hypothetical protein